MYVENLILNDNLIVSEDCINLKKEFESYVWDDKNDGQPIQKNDDALDALRYAIFSSEYQNSYY